MKHCKRCDRTLPIEGFHKHKNSKDGHAFYCKECMSEYGKKYRKTPQGMYSTTKGSVNFYNNTTLEISREDYYNWHNSQEKKCVYCGIPEDDLIHMGNYYYEKCDRLTVDRKDNSVGYKEGNIVLSCYRCNMTKGDVFSFDEMVEIGHKYLEPKWRANKEKEEQS